MAVRAVDLCVALLFEPPSPASVEGVLRAHGEVDPVVSDADVVALRGAAGRLMRVFGADSPAEAVAVLNGMLVSAPRLTSHAGATTWHLHVDSSDEAPWGEWFLASSAMALAVLLADHQRVPGGLCASGACGRPYLDLGGGSPRRYCSARCATRERVALHRSRT